MRLLPLVGGWMIQLNNNQQHINNTSERILFAAVKSSMFCHEIDCLLFVLFVVFFLFFLEIKI